MFFKKFVLYIPKKKLIFENHPYYGKVYPIYIAEKEEKAKIKMITFLAMSLVCFNSYLLLINLGYIPISQGSSFVLYSNKAILFSVCVIIFWLKSYFQYVNEVANKAKSIFLLPSGKKLILEKFSNTVEVIENYDIFKFNIYNGYLQESRKPKFYDNNHNNFHAVLHYGRNKMLVIRGKKVVLDTEIFSYIASRYNIDTSQVHYYDQEKDEKPLDTKFVKANKILSEKIKKRTILKETTFEELRRNFLYKKYLSAKLKNKLINWFY